MLRFGVGPLDERLTAAGAGAEHALLIASPGLDPLPFALHAAVTMMADGATCAFYVNNKPPRSVAAAARAYGYNLEGERLRGRLKIVDGFSPTMGVPAGEFPVVHEPSNPAEIREVVERAAGPDALVFFDSISSWIDLSGAGARGVAKLLHTVGAGRPVFGVFSSWGYPEDVLEAVRAEFDTVVNLQPSEGAAIARQFLVADQIAGKGTTPLALPVKALEPGGVHVYVPKVLVTGPQGAGKTALVSALSATGLTSETQGTTVGLDHGSVTQSGIALELYGTPGAEAFDPLLERIAEDSVAVVLVVDATRPETFPRARQMLSRARAVALPTVVAANKSDLKGALAPAEVKRRLALPGSVPVVATDAALGEGMDQLLLEMSRRLMRAPEPHPRKARGQGGRAE